MDDPKFWSQSGKDLDNNYRKKILQLEKEVSLGLWVQVLGQIIELKGLSELYYLEQNSNKIGEQQILTGVWTRTIGQILEAIFFSKQLGETDVEKLTQDQKMAITGDLLVSIGSAIEVIGGINVLEEETIAPPSNVP